MAEVGVLELQIRDNATEAGSGLNQLADALGRVKSAIPAGKNGGIGLSKVGTELNALARQINNAKSGTANTIKNITALFNSISGLSKIKSIKIDLTPLEEIKKAIGDGLNLGNTGTQLKNMRDALSKDWDATGAVTGMGQIATAVNEMGQSDTAGKLSAISKALTAYSKAYEALPKSNKKMEAIVQNIAMGITKADIDEQRRYYEEATARAREKWEASGRHGIPLDLQFHAEKGTGSSSASKIITDVTNEAKEEFEEVKSKVVGVADAAKDWNGQFKDVVDTEGQIVAQFNLINKQVMSDSVSHLKNRFENAKEEADIYANRMSSYVLPKVQKISSEEMMIAYNAREATKAITNMVKRLNQIKNPKGKGFSNVVDAFTGVSRPMTNKGEDAAKTFQENTEYLDRVEQELERVAEVNERVTENSEGVRSIIGLDKIPASGMNGPFQNAQEEIESLNNQLKQSTADMEFWEKTYTDLQKRIKYNGETEERKNMLGHAEEGYFQSLEKVDQTQAALEKVNDYVREYTENMDQAAQATTDQAESMQAMEAGMQTYSSIEEAAKAMGISVTEAKEKIKSVNDVVVYSGNVADEAANKLYNYKAALQMAQHQSQRIELTRQTFADASAQTKEYVASLIGMKPEEIWTETTAAVNDATTSVVSYADKAKKVLNSVKQAFNSLWGAAKKSPLAKIVNQFSRIAKYRFLRAVLKHITAGFSEGVQNVYNYSKLVGTELAPAMDSAASAFLQFKNSIGAAVSPLIQMFIPIIKQIIDVVINAINYLNQFFALLNGQATWTRALPATTTAFGKQEKAAKGAAAAVKDLLADWDELNIIQSNTSGAGNGIGTNTAEDYLNMFEEVSKFDKAIQDTVAFLKENLGLIEGMAIAIGTAMLGWKLSNGLREALPFLAKLASWMTIGATIGLSIMVTDLLGKAYIDTKDPGYLIANALAGGLGATIAGEIATKLAGGEAGLSTAGFTLILEGIVNVKNAAEAADEGKEAEAWALAALGAVETGIGAALVSKGLFATSTAASIVGGAITAGLTLTIAAAVILDAKNKYTNRIMAYRAFAKAGKNGISPQAYLQALQERFDKLTEGATLVVDAMMGFDDSKGKFKESIEQLESLNTFITSGASLTESQAESFKKAWDIVFDELNKLGEMSYESVFYGLEEALTKGTANIKEAATELKTQFIEIAKLTGGARGAAEEEMRQYMEELSVGNTENLERYLELYNIWGGKDTEDQIKEYTKEALSRNIKFSEENPAQDAVDFIKEIQDGMVNPALELVNKEYEDEMKGIQQQREDIEKALKSGYINDAQAKAANESLDRIAQVFDDFHQQQLDEIDAISKIAYDKIANELLAGYYDSEMDDQGRQSYIENVVTPVVKALESAGAKLPASIENLLKITEGLRESGVTNTSRNQAYADTYGRAETYRNLIDAYMSENEYTDMSEVDDFRKLIDYILSHVSETSLSEEFAKLTDIDKQDIVNALLTVLPDIAIPEVFSMLSDVTKKNFNGGAFAGLGQLLSWTNWGSLSGRNGEQYQYGYNGNGLEFSMDYLAECINALIDTYNFNNPEDQVERINGLTPTGGSYVAQQSYETEEDVSSGVQKGTQFLTAQIISAINAQNIILQQLINRPVNVNLTADPRTGLWNKASKRQLEKVTGEP